MASKRLDRIAGILAVPADLDVEAAPLIDSHLHGDADAICPRCLTWIGERDYVRQTAYGLLQHEVCPPA